MSDTVIVALLGLAGTLIGSVIGLFGGTIIESKRAKNERKIDNIRNYSYNSLRHSYDRKILKY